MNNNLIIIILLILIILIILILINNNFKENFICINPKTYDNKVCKSNFKNDSILISQNYCNNNNNCNGYISFDFKDIFNNKNTLYYKCLDNWSGELLSKDILYDKLKKKNPDINFYNFKTHKCNNYCPPGKGIIDNSNTCVECPKNKYNTGDSYLCKDIPTCPTGYDLIDYDNKTGNTNCKFVDLIDYYYDVNDSNRTQKLYENNNIIKSSIIGSSDKYIEFRYNPDTTQNGQTEYKINFTYRTMCDILIIGGGGAGGNSHGAGGGAGALIYYNNLILNGDYTIKVGKGGVADSGFDTEFKNTSNSKQQFIAKGGGRGKYKAGYIGEEKRVDNPDFYSHFGYINNHSTKTLDGWQISTNIKWHWNESITNVLTTREKMYSRPHYHEFGSHNRQSTITVIMNKSYYLTKILIYGCWGGLNTRNPKDIQIDGLTSNGWVWNISGGTGKSNANLWNPTTFPINNCLSYNGIRVRILSNWGDNSVKFGVLELYHKDDCLAGAINVDGGSGGGGAPGDNISGKLDNGNIVNDNSINIINDITTNDKHYDNSIFTDHNSSDTLNDIGCFGNYGGNHSGSSGGAGGGGAGTKGESTSGGNGGSGKKYNITGKEVYYAAGGGGSNTITPGLGANNIGGNGETNYDNILATDGKNNTGSGGGGAYTSSTYSGKGGSGIVIIRYKHILL